MRGIKMATPMPTRKYTRAATTDSKSGKLASNFGKLLENDFCMFCQILKDGKSFTKMLEMLLQDRLIAQGVNYYGVKTDIKGKIQVNYSTIHTRQA